MSQLYARVFLQILDSSIAEDFTARHVFEDFLKLSEDGIVDMTRSALSRRLNCPMDILNRCITKLEEPDPSSRDSEFEGRRIERLDAHRDWGWRILNWTKYDEMRTRADVAIRVARHRKKKEKPSEPNKNLGGSAPTIEECRLLAVKAGIPESEGDKFFNHHAARGWMLGKVRMKSAGNAMGTWASNYRSGTFGGNGELSVFELKTVIDTKEKQALDLRNRHYTEAPTGGTWSDACHRDVYRKLKGEIKALTEQLSKKGTQT